MIARVRYHIRYNRKKKLNKNGKAPVVIEAYQYGPRRYIPTGIEVKPSEWDERKNQVKSRPDYNRTIQSCILKLEEFELQFPIRYGRPFKLDDFDLLLEQQKPGATPEPLTFTAFMLEQVDRDAAKVEPATTERYKVAVQRLIEYNGGKPVPFDALTYSFIEGFDHFLRTATHKVGRNRTIEGCQQNTIYKVHQRVNKYIERAGKAKHLDKRDNPYQDFKFEKEPTEKEVLHQSEIRRIEQLTFADDRKHLTFYRDVFLLAYYTLLRISDVTAIRQSHLIKENEGLMLEIKAKKTGKINRLPLFALHKLPDGPPSKPERILQAYARTDNKPLFGRSHQKINDYLKEVFKLAGINKSATFHTARHSGITFLVQEKVAMAQIQLLAQHSSIKTTMDYVHISTQQVIDGLDDVKW